MKNQKLFDSYDDFFFEKDCQNKIAPIVVKKAPIPMLLPQTFCRHAPVPTKILSLKTDYKTHNRSPSHASMPMWKTRNHLNHTMKLFFQNRSSEKIALIPKHSPKHSCPQAQKQKLSLKTDYQNNNYPHAPDPMLLCICSRPHFKKTEYQKNNYPTLHGKSLQNTPIPTIPSPWKYKVCTQTLASSHSCSRKTIKSEKRLGNK